MKIRARFTWKTIFGIVVVLGIAWHFCKTLTNAHFTLDLRAIRWHHLIAAAVLYWINHAIWGTYWWQLLRFEKQHVSWRTAMRVYFFSQLGKYVPGKAWVIVMRVAMLRKYGADRTVVAITGVLETLVSMGTGAILAVAALAACPVGFSPMADRRLAFLGIAAAPVIGTMGLWLLRRYLYSRNPARSASVPVPSPWLLALGSCQAAIGWCCLAFSLYLCLTALRIDLMQHGALFVVMMAAITTAYVAGFFILIAPGGLGVREWALAVLLTAGLEGFITHAEAIILALLLRCTWTIAEILLAAILWILNTRTSFMKNIEP